MSIEETIQPHGTHRLLAFIGNGRVTMEEAADGRVMVRGERGVIALPGSAIAAALAANLVERRRDELWLTDAGRASRHDRYQAQHRLLEQQEIESPDRRETVTVNLAESPLGQLARRRGKDGRTFLSDGEIRAGERLRVDWTRGQLMPGIGMSWQSAASSGRRTGGGGGGAVELTDAALAARQRVEQAVDATGPELSGVLIDVCCFLKGLEQVEAERGWPVRSAKVMLKAALGALWRHYEPAREGRGRARSFHWGTEDFRPVLR